MPSNMAASRGDMESTGGEYDTSGILAGYSCHMRVRDGHHRFFLTHERLVVKYQAFVGKSDETSAAPPLRASLA